MEEASEQSHCGAGSTELCLREHALFHSGNGVPQRGQRRLRLRGEELLELGRGGDNGPELSRSGLQPSTLS